MCGIIRSTAGGASANTPPSCVPNFSKSRNRWPGSPAWRSATVRRFNEHLEGLTENGLEQNAIGALLFQDELVERQKPNKGPVVRPAPCFLLTPASSLSI